MIKLIYIILVDGKKVKKKEKGQNIMKMVKKNMMEILKTINMKDWENTFMKTVIII